MIQIKLLRELNKYLFSCFCAAVSGLVVPCHCKYFSKQKKQKYSFICIVNLTLKTFEMEQSYKDIAQSIFLFVVLCLFMVIVFLHRTVSIFFYDYSD